MMRVDETGNKYGHLTFLNPLGPGRAGEGTIWLLKCDCGRLKEANRKAVIVGHMKTCGKIGCPFLRALKTRKPQRDARAKERAWYRRHVHNIANRNKVWAIPPELFFQIMRLPCTLCGDISKPFNSVDRHDPAQEYSPANVIPICLPCKFHLRSTAPGKYIQRLGKILTYISNGPHSPLDNTPPPVTD